MTLRVFVADDSITIQKIVALAFAHEDVLIEAASDGNAAVESLRSFNPDIVLADVFMPGRSGYEVCEYVKEDQELQHVPVILLVGTFEPFDQAEASRVKCDGYLTKPFDTEELTQTIRAHVGEKLSISEPADNSKIAVSDIPRLGRLVTPAAVTSFLGENRILDVFYPGVVPEKSAAIGHRRTTDTADLSEEDMSRIVDKVVRRMSPDVIREVAWEVVPELSETIIRQTIKDQK